MSAPADRARQKRAVCEEFIRISVFQQAGPKQAAEIGATSYGYHEGSKVAKQFIAIDCAQSPPDGQFDGIAD